MLLCFLPGIGLIYYGQNFLIYPSAFPPGSRIGVWTPKKRECPQRNEIANIPSQDVPLPSQFGLHYEDLELKTSDNVILRCYLIPQKKKLGVHMEIPEGTTEDEVRFFSLSLHLSWYTLFHTIVFKSLLPVDRPWLCFMGMVETLVIEFLSLLFLLWRCDAMSWWCVIEGVCSLSLSFFLQSVLTLN
jgi:hypothetical protein